MNLLRRQFLHLAAGAAVRGGCESAACSAVREHQSFGEAQIERGKHATSLLSL
jgi:hypothetical protein